MQLINNQPNAVNFHQIKNNFIEFISKQKIIVFIALSALLLLTAYSIFRKKINATPSPTNDRETPKVNQTFQNIVPNQVNNVEEPTPSIISPTFQQPQISVPSQPPFLPFTLPVVSPIETPITLPVVTPIETPINLPQDTIAEPAPTYHPVVDASPVPPPQIKNETIAPNDLFTYQGETFLGQPHGKGKITKKGDKKFLAEGEFIDGKFRKGMIRTEFEDLYGDFPETEHENLFSNRPWQMTFTGKKKSHRFELKGTFSKGQIIHGYGYRLTANGDRHEGHFDNGELNGKGFIKHADGRVSKGVFENGDLSEGHGFRTIDLGLKNPLEGIYEGDIFDFRPHGKGRLTIDENIYFEGTFERGEFVHGTLYHTEGQFIGSFKNFKLEGPCKKLLYTIPGIGKNVICEEGIYRNGMLIRGSVLIPPYGRYEGPLEGGKPSSGMGKFTLLKLDTNGKEIVIRGKFIDGLPAGKCTLTYGDGKTFSGIFNGLNIVQGEGTKKFDNGDEYTGPLVNGLPNGKKGKYVGKDKSSEGEYVNGKLIKGVLINADGTHDGIFDKNEFLISGKRTNTIGEVFIISGTQGEITHSDGRKSTGIFDGDQLVTGKGLINWLEGTYYGEVRDRKPHGKGAWVAFPKSANEWSAMGIYENGQFKRGIRKYPDRIDSGNFEMDIYLVGKGSRKTLHNGKTYSGNFKFFELRTLLDGPGTITDSDNRVENFTFTDFEP